jgi:hypothetical protein
VALAQNGVDPEIRARLLQRAKAWRDLADKAENPKAS